MTTKIRNWIFALLLLGGGGLVVGDVAIQTDNERDRMIDQRQELYFAEHGEYFQILENKGKPTNQTRGFNELLPNIRGGNNIVIDVHELYGEKWYTIREIPPPFVNSTST